MTKRMKKRLGDYRFMSKEPVLGVRQARGLVNNEAYIRESDWLSDNGVWGGTRLFGRTTYKSMYILNGYGTLLSELDACRSWGPDRQKKSFQVAPASRCCRGLSVVRWKKTIWILGAHVVRASSRGAGWSWRGIGRRADTMERCLSSSSVQRSGRTRPSH